MYLMDRTIEDFMSGWFIFDRFLLMDGGNGKFMTIWFGLWMREIFDPEEFLEQGVAGISWILGNPEKLAEIN